MLLELRFRIGERIAVCSARALVSCGQELDLDHVLSVIVPNSQVDLYLSFSESPLGRLVLFASTLSHRSSWLSLGN